MKEIILRCDICNTKKETAEEIKAAMTIESMQNDNGYLTFKEVCNSCVNKIVEYIETIKK